MRNLPKHRFYQPGHYETGKIFSLNNKNSGHIARVLRLKQGTEIILFDGKNTCCQASLLEISRKSVEIKVGTVSYINNESPLKIHLLQGLSKGDRFDWVVQKAVELGVHSLSPIISARNVLKLDDKRKLKKMQHWQGIIESASEQCGRNTLMQLQPISLLKHQLLSLPTEIKLMLVPGSNKQISLATASTGSLTLLIGPEGGFTEDEIEQAQHNGFEGISFYLPFNPQEKMCLRALFYSSFVSVYLCIY